MGRVLNRLDDSAQSLTKSVTMTKSVGATYCQGRRTAGPYNGGPSAIRTIRYCLLPSSALLDSASQGMLCNSSGLGAG
jgi:hypothetical protein